MPDLTDRPARRRDPIRAATAGPRRLLRLQTILLAVVGVEAVAFMVLRWAAPAG